MVSRRQTAYLTGRTTEDRKRTVLEQPLTRDERGCLLKILERMVIV